MQSSRISGKFSSEAILDISELLKLINGLVRIILFYVKEVKDCMGYGICQTNGGKCVQKDDMAGIYNEMLEADVIVFASPVYFYTWTFLMKFDSYYQYISCFSGEGNKDGGILMAYGRNSSSDAKESDYMQRAYNLGNGIEF